MAKKAPSYTTKPPTGLNIKREGNRCVLSWKAGDKDIEYQEVKYWAYDKNEYMVVKKFNNGNVNSLTTEALDNFQGVIEFPFYVNGTTFINLACSHKLVFYVRQRRKDFQEYYYKGSGEKKKKVKYKGKTNPKISEWVKKEFVFEKPKNPNLSWEVGSEDSDTIFKWDFSNFNNDNTKAAGFKFITQTMYVQECNVTDGSKLNWSGATYKLYSAANSREIEHSAGVISGKSSMQWFRCKVLGGGIGSDWKYACRVFAYPNRASNVRGSSKVIDSNVFSINASWSTATSASRPCENTIMQYAFAKPESDLSAPTISSWNDTTKVSRLKPNDNIRVEESGGYGLDQCLYIRVNTYHDNYVTYGLATRIGNGYLKMPENLSINITDVDARTATISADNQSEVEGSFLAVYYRGEKNPNQTLIIGIIPWDETEVDVVFPKDGSTQPSWGVEAVVGSYSARRRADGVTEYSVTRRMTSADVLWEKFDVPFPPTGVSAVAVDGKEETVKVVWNWSWSGANQAEVAWADHDDAWESTDEPETHIITSKNRSHLYVKGITAGKRWYFAVRLIKDDDDEHLESAWSKVVSVDLAVAPQKPSLVLSQNSVVVGGEVTASWSYVSEDGTAQAHADVCKVTVSGSGATYGAIVAYADTQKHVTLRAERTATQTLYAVRTVSASGKKSPWSDPVPLTTVTPIGVSIGTLPNNSHPSWKAASDATYVKVVDDNLLYQYIDETYGADEEQTFSGTLDLARGEDEDVVVLNVLDLEVPFEPIVLSGTVSGSLENVYNKNNYYVVIENADMTERVVIPDDELVWSITGSHGEDFETTVPAEVLEKYCGDFESGYSAYVMFSRIKGMVLLEGEVYNSDQLAGIGLEIPNNLEGNDEVNGTIFYRFTDYEGSDEVSLNVIRDLPFTIPITTTGVINSVTAHLERLGAYYAPSPDDSTATGYDKEIVASRTVIGQPTSVVLDLVDKLSSIDDGSMYNLVVTVRDGVGQTAEDTEPVICRWTDQAKMPSATVTIDEDIALIRPMVDSPATGATCDIYRLSADRPEMIVEGGTFGTTYVDPYPALGEYGGHRVVYRTKNGDYIDADGQKAWIDLGMNEDDYVPTERAIIEFGGEKVVFNRNVDLDSSWDKDFTETKYLGGSIQGDWNEGVERTGSISTVAITLVDEDMIRSMRRLATYAGICHIRTQDGSSYNANVNVSESRPHDVYGTRATFSLDITRVDSEELEGMTLADWKAQNGLD